MVQGHLVEQEHRLGHADALHNIIALPAAAVGKLGLLIIFIDGIIKFIITCMKFIIK